MPMDAATPRQVPARRFGLFDTMILVAALALGLAILRVDRNGLDALGIVLQLIGPDPPWRAVARHFSLNTKHFATSPLLVVTLAVLAMRLRRPRPRWRRLVRQPGFVAGLVMVPAWAMAICLTVGSIGYDPLYRPDGATDLWSRILATGPETWFFWLSSYSSPTTGFGVAVAWATLALVDRWRAEPSWIDRLGRAIGAAWIMMAVFEVVVGSILLA